eukprot:TRINITY_DN1374_c0_g1_i5.p1 TRINITY_DN1374_c0_g1~~TRINITY_DN1374_c0_g1_i5.p1  ORF type:complete len:349 (+),score=172.98 TRINITY_DN1374_c0_g1_i5:126-1172(+)
MSQITFKIYFKDQIRRITLPPPSFSQMVLYLSQIIPGDYRITYYDCDGDHITITSQIEWECALLESKDKSVLRILLEPKTGGEDLQLHQSFFASVARAKSSGNDKQRLEQVDQERKKLEVELRRTRIGETQKSEAESERAEEEKKGVEEEKKRVEEEKKRMEEEKKRAEEEKKRAEEEKKRAEEEAKKRVEDAKKRVEEAKKRVEEEEAREKAEAEAKHRAEEEIKRKAQKEEEAKRREEEEEAKRKAEDEERKRAEELAKFAEERRLKLEAEAKQRDLVENTKKLIDSVIEERKQEKLDPNHAALAAKWKTQVEQLQAMGFEITAAKLRQLDSVQGSLVAFLETEYC